MKSVPLTRARHASNFALALEAKGIPTNRLLNRSNLSVELLEDVGNDGVISALSMLDFAEQAALHTGIFDLGIWAGTAPLEGYGEFGKRVANAHTLHSAIMTFCREVHSECSKADYYLTSDGSSAWFCHGPVAVSPSHQSQHELYALMIMIQVIQLALGSDWTPGRIRLQSPDESGAWANDLFLKTDIEFAAPNTAVEIPLKSLAIPLRQSIDKTHTITSVDVAFSADPLIALKNLITLYIKQSKQPSIELAAELTGMSKRTLQRFLHSKSTSYSRLIDEVRFDMTIPLLNDKSFSITKISYELGYADVAHFSRAFKRISGMSPRAYRQMLRH